MNNTSEFEWPELDEIGYRLFCLWRLIGISVLIPVITMIVTQLVLWPFTGQAPAYFIAYGLFCAIPIGAHAVLFPNASSETLAIGLGFAVLALVEPMISGFGAVRFVELLGVMLLVMLAPSWIERAVHMGKRIDARLKTSIRTDADLLAARRAIALRPNQLGPIYRTGPLDIQGFFAVMDPCEPDPFDRLDGGPSARVMSKPLFWARVATDASHQQVTEIFTRDRVGDLVQVSTVVHDFENRGALVHVTQTEHLPKYPLAAAVMKWASGQGYAGLTLHRDTLEGRTTMSLSRAHRQSLGSVARSYLPSDGTSSAALS